MSKVDNGTFLIWKNFQAGNKEAFAFFYNLYVNDLFRYGTKLCSDDDLVKDAIQDVFIDLYNHRNSNSTDPLNLKYYLLLALKRDLIKKIKKIRKLTNHTGTEIIFEPEYSIESILIEREEESLLKRNMALVLRELPSKQKEVLYLRFNQAMPYSEIAKVMNISVESARKQVYRAIKKIRNIFEQHSFVLMLLFRGK
ncbi:MAG: sigma-70 family RNA polymerase sigma factor [Prolixibacteraceae bacterium]|nr:sigma-70 family RNA polymerase sigma factor [Prolixibacteraceae bacterium]